MSVYERMKRLHLTLPDLAHAHQFLRTSVGNLVFVARHAPFEGGEFRYKGKLGREKSIWLQTSGRSAPCSDLFLISNRDELPRCYPPELLN
jgi:hypothetical protein